MPWKIIPDNGKYKVVNAETGRVLGTHTSRKSAMSQVRALYANVPESRKESIRCTIESIFKEKMGDGGRQGNIHGLAKHIFKKHLGNPHLWTACFNDEELADYDKEARSAICARCVKIATGHWPGEKRGKNPYGLEPATRRRNRLKK